MPACPWQVFSCYSIDVSSDSNYPDNLRAKSAGGYWTEVCRLTLVYFA
jgi:hypothetical protein